MTIINANLLVDSDRLEFRPERLLSALSWRGIASFPLQGEAHPGHAPAID